MYFSTTSWGAWGYLPLTASVAIVHGILSGLERGDEARRWNERVAYYRLFGTERRQELVDRIWSSSTRYGVERDLAADLLPTADGVAERFPFTNAYRGRITVSFWLVATLSATALLLPATGMLPKPVNWLTAVLGALLVYPVSRLRRAYTLAGTILEITPTTIAIEDPEGSREYLSFSSALVIRDQPKLHRAELIDVERRRLLPLDYERAGFVRAVELVLKHGGFQPGNTAV